MDNFKLINKEVRIEPTNACNAKCIMCPREKMTRKQGIMPMHLYMKILDQCIGAGAEMVSIENYGESLLDPYFIDRAKYAKSRGLKVLTITNGSLVHKVGYYELMSYVDIIRISMYANSKDTYEKIHKGLDFYDVVNNIDKLISIRDNGRYTRKIHLYFLLMKENKHELQEWLDKYENIADVVSVWKPHNWGDGRTYREIHENKKSCNRPFVGNLQVQWDGKVVPCCFDYNNAKVLGDFNKQTLKEIMGSKEYNELREIHKSGEFHRAPFCYGCDQLNKREDVLIYTTEKNVKVGATNTAYFDLLKKDIYPIGIGTVWFGRYFPPNKPYTYPSIEETNNYLDYAFRAIGDKTLMIDTANSYGYSEGRLGLYFKNNKNNLSKSLIATKWGELLNPDGTTTLDHSIDNLNKSFNNSLLRLGKVDILYIHRPTLQILDNSKIIRTLNVMRNKRLFSYIGVSISDEYTLEYSLDYIDWIDIIQFPVHIFIDRKDLVNKIIEKNIKIVLNSPIRKSSEFNPEGIFKQLCKDRDLFVVLTGTRNHLEEVFNYTK